MTYSKRPLNTVRAAAFAPLLCLLSVLVRSAVAAPAPPATPDPESYYGVYLKAPLVKLGYVIMRHQDVPATGTQPAATRQEMVMSMDLKMLGAPASVKSTSISLTDAKTGRPLSEETRTETGGRTTVVTATFTDKSVHYISDVAGSKDEGDLPLPPGEHFLMDLSSGPSFRPQAGMVMEGMVFVGEALKLSKEKITIAAPEPVPGESVSAFKVIEDNGISGQSISYINEEGDMLLSSAPLGIEIRKQPKEVALASPAPGTVTPDLVSLVAITPTGATISDPRTAREVHYTISHVTRRFPSTDSVQAVDYKPEPSDNAPGTALVTVTANPLPASGGRLYPKATDAPATLQPYLKSTQYVPASSPTFQGLAKQVVGGETDAAKAAAKIAAWVHETVKPDPSIAALRGAADVYQTPRGVCRDYTVLFTAVARAAGLPTKQCVGIVNAEGRFFYHAWPEVWIGDHWVALEPTFGAPFADATHIKLAEGEITDVTNVAADIGKYQIQVDQVK